MSCLALQFCLPILVIQLLCRTLSRHIAGGVGGGAEGKCSRLTLKTKHSEKYQTGGWTLDLIILKLNIFKFQNKT